jgi:hypothetical protein
MWRCPTNEEHGKFWRPANTAAGQPMKDNVNCNDAKLSALLRAGRPSPGLPPRFQDDVWRRIEADGTRAASAPWLETLAAWILRPRHALATATLLLLAGVVLGAHEGSQAVRKDAQARYLAVFMLDPAR